MRVHRGDQLGQRPEGPGYVSISERKKVIAITAEQISRSSVLDPRGNLRQCFRVNRQKIFPTDEGIE